ncbi:MAG: hypothetical protein OHK0046_40060 [Anaerolineae bacterium]
MRKWSLLLVLAVLLAVVPAAAQNTPQSVCLITDVGFLFDGGFNQSTYNGVQRAVEVYGLSDTFIETQAATDYEANIQRCLNDGFDIVITVGFALTDATRAAAIANPDHYFIGVDQDFLSVEPVPNLVGLQFREDQGGFLAGAMAALMTESNIVGGVYGVDFAPVVKFRNGFEQGARYINPDITALGSYTESFETPTIGAEVALTLIGEGADVIFGAGGRTGTGAIREAAARDTLVIGVDLDQYFTDFEGGDAPGAENIITSALKSVDNGVFTLIERLVNGGAFPDNSTYVVSIANGGIDFAPTHDADVPQEVLERLTDIREGLREGTIVTGVDPVFGTLLPDLAEVAADAGDFSTLLLTAQAAGLLEALSGDEPLTIFAPTDAAFLAELEFLGASSVEELLNNPEGLSTLLRYHVIPGQALTTEIIETLDITTVETLDGDTLELMIDADGQLTVDGSPVITADVPASNGIIHVIETVLVPPSQR